MNKAILSGNLGSAPEMFHGEGFSVAKLRLCTNSRYKNKKGESVETSEWHNIEVWNRLAINAEKYLKKGSKIFVEGKLKTDEYMDKKGEKRYSTKIIVNYMEFL